MNRKKANQKFISFTDNTEDIKLIKEDMKAGWSIISLVKNGNYYVGIMEEIDPNTAQESHTIFIPPRKKLKMSI